MGRVLEHRVNIVIIVEVAVRLSDVWVTLTEAPLNLELLAHLPEEVILGQQIFLDYFESNCLIAALLDSLVYFTKFTGADPLAQLEVVDDEGEFWRRTR